MAEATDRPADKAVTAAIPKPRRPPRRTRRRKSTARFRSSAILGFVLAVLYAVVVGVGAAHRPVQPHAVVLPLWSLGGPLAAAVVCWAARVRIRNSEGALTGTRLTVWGVWPQRSSSVCSTPPTTPAATWPSRPRRPTFTDEWIDTQERPSSTRRSC